MRINKVVAALGAVTLVGSAAACSGGGDDAGTGPGTGSSMSSGGTYSVAELEPKHLIPARTSGSPTDQLNALFANLTKVNADGKLVNVHAKSVESSQGGKVWTIKLKPGWTFHNGQTVTARSYVRAWNTAAYGPNAWVDGGQFANILGYSALNPESGKPTTKKMSGLKVADKYTIKVTLSKPDSQFPLELTTNAYLPMPKVAFKDLKAYDEAPIGDGPYKMVGKWEHNQQIVVERYDDYKGEVGKADKITFKIYTNDHAAYVAAQANQVDIISIGQADYIQAKQTFGDNFIAFDAPAIDYLGFPLYSDEYFGDKRVRKAISMAINRKAINKA
ncbi:MAG: peptide ABC transporter substrate-binding protein, partial [Nocardioidaceae bacterium]